MRRDHYRPRKWQRFYTCLSVCLLMCLSLFPDDNFWTNWPTHLIVSMEVGHHNIQVTFEYQGNRSSSKQKKLKFSISLQSELAWSSLYLANVIWSRSWSNIKVTRSWSMQQHRYFLNIKVLKGDQFVLNLRAFSSWRLYWTWPFYFGQLIIMDLFQ